MNANPSAQLLGEIAAKAAVIVQQEPSSAGPLWGTLHKLLLKAKADPQTVGRLVATRDLPGLESLVRRLRGEDPVPSSNASVPSVASPAVAPIDAETLRHAMRAFRKRLKLTRLDHQSRLGVGPMTSGRAHDVDAMIPPREFPLAVWEALADAGRLRRTGQGFYALTEEETP